VEVPDLVAIGGDEGWPIFPMGQPILVVDDGPILDVSAHPDSDVSIRSVPEDIGHVVTGCGDGSRVDDPDGSIEGVHGRFSDSGAPWAFGMSFGGMGATWGVRELPGPLVCHGGASVVLIHFTIVGLGYWLLMCRPLVYQCLDPSGWMTAGPSSLCTIPSW
jgi:hypothetical protein